jgi:hypothetical protein
MLGIIYGLALNLVKTMWVCHHGDDTTSRKVLRSETGRIADVPVGVASWGVCGLRGYPYGWARPIEANNSPDRSDRAGVIARQSVNEPMYTDSKH